MRRIPWSPLVLAAWLAVPPCASAQTYWLGRRPDPARDAYVFDVPLPADLAAALTCSGPPYARLKAGVTQRQWQIDGKTYTFLENPISWNADAITRGAFAFLRNGAVRQTDWAHVQTQGADWKAARDVLLAQKKPAFGGDWSQVTPILLASAGDDNPRLTVRFDGAPFSILRHPGEYDSSVGAVAATKKPQIVAVVRGNQLYIAYQTWDRSRPTDKIVVSKVAITDLGGGKMTAVREVASLGTLVGFTVDGRDADWVLTARAEDFANSPEGDFVDAIDKTWRPGVVVLYRQGQGTDLNSDTYTAWTFYGLCSSGTGRLAAGGDHLAAVFSRRRLSTKDGAIHQQANALLMATEPLRALIKADNTVSHSFDQRLIFDGEDFVALHQGDQYPAAALLIEKLRSRPGDKERAVRLAAYAGPTFSNDVFFELGGVAAEKDGYPVLLTAVRGTEPVDDKSVESRRAAAWDLAMVYVVRDFDSREAPANPFDIVGSGILARDYAEPEELTVDNFAWNPGTSDWTRRERRAIRRRVRWLTAYGRDRDVTRKATCPKLVQLGAGRYIALYEEHVLADGRWSYEQTRAALLTVGGDHGSKQITSGPPKALEGLRLHRGDDPVTLTVDGVAHAAWVTAATNKRLILHTLDENLRHKARPLELP
jgi:hypothetical protein